MVICASIHAIYRVSDAVTKGYTRNIKAMCSFGNGADFFILNRLYSK